MSAPGHSGARPEHLREALGVRSRSAGNRQLSALSAFLDQAASGALIPEMHWLARSRLVFIAKKSAPKPRPTRVGELLRRVVAKRLARDHQSTLRHFFAARRQFGVALPGGARRSA